MVLNILFSHPLTKIIYKMLRKKTFLLTTPIICSIAAKQTTNQTLQAAAILSRGRKPLDAAQRRWLSTGLLIVSTAPALVLKDIGVVQSVLGSIFGSYLVPWYLKQFMFFRWFFNIFWPSLSGMISNFFRQHFSHSNHQPVLIRNCYCRCFKPITNQCIFQFVSPFFIAPKKVFIAPAAMSRSLRKQKGLVQRRRATVEVLLTLRLRLHERILIIVVSVCYTLLYSTTLDNKKSQQLYHVTGYHAYRSLAASRQSSLSLNFMNF